MTTKIHPRQKQRQNLGQTSYAESPQKTLRRPWRSSSSCEGELIRNSIRRLVLLIDKSGEDIVCLSHLFSELADKRQIPYLPRLKSIRCCYRAPSKNIRYCACIT